MYQLDPSTLAAAVAAQRPLQPDPPAGPPYPRIPDLPPQRADESVWQYGVRAFAFLVETGITAGLLDSDALHAALHQSQILVAQRDLAPAALRQYHTIRLCIAEVLRRRDAATATPAVVPIADRDPFRGGLRPEDGTREPLPVRPRPLAPAGAFVVPAPTSRAAGAFQHTVCRNDLRPRVAPVDDLEF